MTEKIEKNQPQELSFEKRDEFQRRKIAENIIQLLTSEIDISPLVIDGGWGTGKSEFCEKLIHLFNTANNNYQIAYIDAFKADHTNEPLLTILAEIIKLQPENKKTELIKKITPVLRVGLKTLAKASVSHILRQNPEELGDEFNKAIQTTAEETLNASIDLMLKDHIEAQQNLDTLQAVLTNLATEKPIVIFIDELDRCRPDFAISMLEVIKHTFNIPNIKFVLITNMEQLKASVNHCYGNQVDAQNYLDKFLKFKISLPLIVENNFVSTQHFKNLVENSKHLDDELLFSCNWNIIERCIRTSNLSLRDVETLILNFEIYEILIKQISSYNPVFKPFAILSICLFSIYPDVAKKCLYGKPDPNDFDKLLGEEQSLLNINFDKISIDYIQACYILLNLIYFNKNDIDPYQLTCILERKLGRFYDTLEYILEDLKSFLENNINYLNLNK